MASRELSNGARTIERWTNEGTPGYYSGNPLTKQRDLTSDEAADLAAMDAANAAAGNGQSLRDKAQTALSNNATFLAIGSPTNAQVSAQVKALTRQMNALIRLTLNQLDDISGT